MEVVRKYQVSCFPQIWGSINFDSKLNPDAHSFSYTAPITSQVAYHFLRQLLYYLSPNEGDVLFLIQTVGVKGLMTFPTSESLIESMDMCFHDREFPLQYSDVLIDTSIEISPLIKQTPPPKLPSPVSSRTRLREKYKKEREKNEEDEKKGEDPDAHLVPRAIFGEHHGGKELEVFPNLSQSLLWIRRKMGMPNFDVTFDNRFNIPSPMRIYPNILAFDISNIQSPHPTILLDEDGYFIQKGVYASFPSMLGLKIYSTFKNRWISPSSSLPFNSIHIGAKSLQHSWGLGDGDMEGEMNK